MPSHEQISQTSPETPTESRKPRYTISPAAKRIADVPQGTTVLVCPHGHIPFVGVIDSRVDSQKQQTNPMFTIRVEDPRKKETQVNVGAGTSVVPGRLKLEF